MSCEHAITPCPHQPIAFLSRYLSLSMSLNHVVMGEVYYDTTFNIPHDFKYCRLTPQTNTGLLQYALSSLTHISEIILEGL